MVSGTILNGALDGYVVLELRCVGRRYVNRVRAEPGRPRAALPTLVSGAARACKSIHQPHDRPARTKPLDMEYLPLSPPAGQLDMTSLALAGGSCGRTSLAAPNSFPTGIKGRPLDGSALRRTSARRPLRWLGCGRLCPGLYASWSRIGMVIRRPRWSSPSSSPEIA
jgi:hypothetical protein